MKLALTSEELAAVREYALRSEDCEQLSEREFVMDFYDLEQPVTLDLVLEQDGARVDGAAYLAYDDAMDGWYMRESIETEAEVRRALCQAGVLEK